MKQLKIYFIISISIIFGYLMGVSIHPVIADSHATMNANATADIQGISHETVWVNGTKYIVFKSSSGDIEVVR